MPLQPDMTVPCHVPSPCKSEFCDWWFSLKHFKHSVTTYYVFSACRLESVLTKIKTCHWVPNLTANICWSTDHLNRKIRWFVLLHFWEWLASLFLLDLYLHPLNSIFWHQIELVIALFLLTSASLRGWSSYGSVESQIICMGGDRHLLALASG